jgi:hypothetical protein
MPKQGAGSQPRIGWEWAAQNKWERTRSTRRRRGERGAVMRRRQYTFIEKKLGLTLIIRYMLSLKSLGTLRTLKLVMAPNRVIPNWEKKRRQNFKQRQEEGKRNELVTMKMNMGMRKDQGVVHWWRR